MEKNSKGLSSNEAKERILKFGPNQIFTPTKISLIQIFLIALTVTLIIGFLEIKKYFNLQR